MKSFFLSSGTYKYQKNNSKIGKSFRTLLADPFSVVSFQISLDHFRRKPQGRGVEKELFRTYL